MDQNTAATRWIDSRRRLLIQALTLGALGVVGSRANGGVLGEWPRRLSDGRSVHDLRGTVRVNGVPATPETVIPLDAKIETGSGARLVGVVGTEAFLIRENSRAEFALGRGVRQSMRLLSGAMLTVFGKRDRSSTLELATPVMTAGIRGTGVYLEADAEKTYICTCYGETLIEATADRTQNEQVRTQHHEAARYVFAEPQDGKLIVPGPFINHEDAELVMLEALVGRLPPFSVTEDDYQRLRRDY